jgi:multicomponent Na+:H+ antiporter subunit E
VDSSSWRRVTALACWAFLVWLVLTWTRTLEQLLAGAVLALAVAALMAPLGEVARPWLLLDPRRLAAALRLCAVTLGRVVAANVNLARRAWQPSRPLHPGMVVVPTNMRTDGNVAATGLITSLIVDNQVVDVDRVRHELQYHAIVVPHGNRAHPEDDINAPIERLPVQISGRS